MLKKKNSHIFNIDNLLIRLPQMVWIIEKNKPGECLLRIPKEDYDLIKSGVFKNKDLSMNFNGRTYWLSEEIFDKIKKKVKKLATSKDLSFSFREFTDPDTIQDLKVEYDLSPINHLKNSIDDIFFISTKGTERRYGHFYTKLIDQLKDDGIIVNQVYYLNQSYFSQSKDENIKKICYVLASNLLGRSIENDELSETNNRNYSKVYYYDTNYVTINKIDSQINSFLKRLSGDVPCKSKLFLNLVGSNKLNPYTSTEVILNKYVRTFENFISSYKKKDKSNLILENKLNEDLSISDRFTDPTQTLSSVKKMLDRSNIIYDYTTRTNIKTIDYVGSVEAVWYHLTIYQYGKILYDVYIKEGMVSILNVYEGTDRECYTMMDLINFISNDNPTLINIGVIKKINEKYIDELVNCINNLSKLKSFFDEYNIEYNYHKMYHKSELWYELNIDNSDIKLNVYNDYIEVMYLDEKKTLYTLYEVVNFISNKLNIKLISESLSDSTKLTDDNKHNVKIITKLLVNSKIKYKMSPSSVGSSGNIIYIINEDDEVQFLIRLFRKIRKIEYVGSVTSYSSSSINNIYDVITFISKYNPNLINRRVLKKINN